VLLRHTHLTTCYKATENAYRPLRKNKCNLDASPTVMWQASPFDVHVITLCKINSTKQEASFIRSKDTLQWPKNTQEQEGKGCNHFHHLEQLVPCPFQNTIVINGPNAILHKINVSFFLARVGFSCQHTLCFATQTVAIESHVKNTRKTRPCKEPTSQHTRSLTATQERTVTAFAHAQVLFLVT
jgi:hypothetical protein